MTHNTTVIFDFPIERNGTTIVVSVTAEVYPGEPGDWYQPDDPAEVMSIEIEPTAILTDAEYSEIEVIAFDSY